MVELEKCICERFQTGETNTDFQCPIHGLEGSKIEASDYRTMGR
jgi:hypothetical protein